MIGPFSFFLILHVMVWMIVEQHDWVPEWKDRTSIPVMKQIISNLHIEGLAFTDDVT